MDELNNSFKNLQVEIDHLPSINQLNFDKLGKKYFSIMILNSIIFFFIVLIGLLYFWYIDIKDIVKPYFQWILITYLLIFLLTLFFIRKSFEFKAFAFRQKDISYKSGWIWRKITTIPFNRVQHCEVSQGIFDRYFGLAKLKIYTAGGSSSDVSIPGLEVEQANDLKHFILNKVEIDA